VRMCQVYYIRRAKISEGTVLLVSWWHINMWTCGVWTIWRGRGGKANNRQEITYINDFICEKAPISMFKHPITLWIFFTQDLCHLYDI
jgi:hypothetical protein